MNPTIKKLWTEALVSGEYEQGVARLRTIDSRFCCLGVLCDIHRQQTEEGKWIKSETYVEGDQEIEVVLYAADGHSFDASLPKSVLNWCDIDKAYATHLAHMNDDDVSFRDIARKIEEDFPDQTIDNNCKELELAI